MLACGYALHRIWHATTAPWSMRMPAGDRSRSAVALPRVRLPIQIGAGAAGARSRVLRVRGRPASTLVVSPNEPNIQLPYIQRHMDATLKAYRLDAVETVDWNPPDRHADGGRTQCEPDGPERADSAVVGEQARRAARRSAPAAHHAVRGPHRLRSDARHLQAGAGAPSVLRRASTSTASATRWTARSRCSSAPRASCRRSRSSVPRSGCGTGAARR